MVTCVCRRITHKNCCQNMLDSTQNPAEHAGNLSGRTPLNSFSAGGIFFSVWTYRTIRILIGGIFLWSGITKLMDSKSFAVIIEAYGLIPESWVMPVAVCLPALEVVAALGLLVDIEGSLAMISSLLVLFMAILGYGIWMGLDVDCGCFGPDDPEGRAYHGLRPALYRDMVVMVGIVYLYFQRYSRRIAPLRLKVLFQHRSGKER
jgi:uncharacterized membrane protein YphA (DoxX/SURF4 family)